MLRVTNWPKIGFGWYHENTLPQALLNDPAWFFEALKDERIWDAFYEGVNELAYKACNIRIPRSDPDNWKIIWSGDLGGGHDAFRIMGPDEPVSDYPFIMSHLDLSWPRRWVGYDNAASAAVSSAFRQNYFGGGELTAERCNQFFSNDENFVFPFNEKFDLC